MTTNTALVEAIATNQLHHARKAKALKLANLLDAEYPALRLDTVRNESGSVTGWNAYHATERATDDGDEPDTTEELTQIYAGDKVPELADLLEVCEEQGLDPEAGADEENDRPSGSVVKEVYRKTYRTASTTGQSCGDWLAEWLTDRTYDHVTGLDVDALTAILNANELDMTRPWAKLPESGQPGWRGRYRMNGRQALEKVVAFRGHVIDGEGTAHEVPEAALAILRAKHAKAIEKMAKQAAAEAEVAKAAAGE